MSVATKNPFALLDDDSPIVTDSSPPTKQDSSPPVPAPRSNQKQRGGPAARAGKYYARGGKPQSKDAATPATADDPVPDAQRKSELRDSGRGRGRGRGRGDSARGRGRQFDRHSQTGKTDSDKKIHQSWGGDDGNTEFKVEQAANTDANNDWAADANAPVTDWAGSAPVTDWAGAAPATDWGAPSASADAPIGNPADKPEGRPRREREPEEEDNTLTYDQYLATKKENESVIPKLEATRKANEGAGDDIWKDTIALTKPDEEEAYFIGKSKSAPKARAKKEDKVYLEIDARFERPDRGGGRGRGARGGDRPPRGATRGTRGTGRGGRQNGPSAVNVDDQTAFPSLS